jgi:hypothetical protein
MKLRHTWGALLGAFLLVVPATACAQANSDPASQSSAASADATDPAAVITAESIHNRIYFLASDALRGRDTPSAGLEAAASYLVSESRRMGMEPGMDGSFYQRWPYRLLGTDLDAARLSLDGPRGAQALVVGEDVALQGGVEGSIDGELVFVGAVDEAPEEGSLAGQVAVFGLPAADGWNQPARVLAGQQARYADLAGARTSIHVLVGLPQDQLQGLAEQLASPGRLMGLELPFPRILISEAAAAEAIPELDALVERATGGERFRHATDVRLTGHMPIRIHDDAHPANVVSVIPGSDPQLRDEYVVLSAHYDHVGVGSPVDGDSIYNGADDNASGTAVLLETARAIMDSGEQPRRSVAFVWVSGEEKGLLGSRWFVENAPWPVEQMVANINTDMVASDAHRDTLVVIGKDYSTLGPLVDEINTSMPELGLVTSDDLWPEQRFFYRSDQFNFMRMEIPSLFFFTGVHECYHRPCDTPSFIDPDKAARIARLLTHSVLAIANADERPQWDPDGLAEVRELTGGR